MTYYQIVEREALQHHAGSKAVLDVAQIAAGQGFKELTLVKATNKISKWATFRRQWTYFWNWTKIANTIENDAVVLLQHPFHNKQATRYKTLKNLKKVKRLKYISLVHDIEEVRDMIFNDYYAREFQEMLELADVIIVHNEVMKDFVVSKGYPADQVVVLEIFDYLHEKEFDKTMQFERSLTVAGNLSVQKSPYTLELAKVPHIKLNLYGPNLSDAIALTDQVKYFGSFPPDEVPKYLDRGFGLVWDGNSIQACSGNSGKYLTFNSPHKLSLYLSSGLPVVVWSQAACAAIVKAHHLGLLVDDLTEIATILDKISVSDYDEYLKNVKDFLEKLKAGFFTQKALKKSLKIIGE